MKKFTTLALALLAVLTLGAVAFAQTSPVTTTGKASPSKAGTAKKPRNTSATVGFTVDPNVKLTLTSIEYTFPRTVKVSGAGFPTCSVEELEGGESGCPTRSKVGSGTAKAFAGTSEINYKFNLYAGGPNSIALRLTGGVELPPFPGRISNGGRKLTVEIPDQVKQPIPGLYSTVENITAKLGAKTIKKGKGKRRKTYNFVQTTGCSGGSQDVGIKLNVANGATPVAPLSATAEIPCSR